ncbi:DNA-binding protein [Candidatus Magnetomorum sp. HK-1]|nr:DNA-binding protein [Candidatus Magnetomorum sp. HK-1]
MRDSIKRAIGETVQDMLNSGFETSFTKKELDLLGITISEIKLTTYQIKSIRKKMNLSQMVFAKLLNVSPSSIRQWEQGKRKPTGPTKILYELLDKSPNLLNYRLSVT